MKYFGSVMGKEWRGFCFVSGFLVVVFRFGNFWWRRIEIIRVEKDTWGVLEEAVRVGAVN